MRRDGSTFPVEVSSEGVLLGNSRILISVIRDITARKHAEAALLESEQKLRLFIEHAPVPLAMFDREMRYITVSREWLRDFGLEGRDLRGVCHYDVFPEIPERWREAHRRGLEGEVVRAEEDRFERKNGTVQWLRWQVRPWYSAEGQIGGIVIFSEDITQRKGAEEKLKQSREDMRLAQAVAHMGSWRLDVLRNELTWSEENYRIFGIAEGTPLKYETFISRIHPDDREYVDRKWKAGLAGENYDIEHRIVVNGKTKWVREKAYLEVDENQKLLGGFGITQDITDRKRIEESVRENQEKLENQTKELEAIIGVVSHDLRAPLVNVKGFNNFIKQDMESIKKLLGQMYVPGPIEQQLKPILEQSIPEATGYIDSSADAMNTLVKSLVEVARAGMAVVKAECLEMNEIVQKVISNLEIKIKEANAQVCVEELPACWADRTQVTQIFTNLIDNAVKYLDPGRPGKIKVSGEVQKDRAVYFVEDNGIGIESKDQSKIFEIFTRLAEKSHAGGEGMGLSMVKRLVDRNRGLIWIQSEKGKGSKFFISLPLASKIEGGGGSK
jgi:PAS domain S-box-containing protein